MYKIYINDHPLILASDTEQVSEHETGLQRISWFGQKKHLINYIDKLEKSTEDIGIVLLTERPKRLYKVLRSLFKPVKAAGGLVLNEANEILFIYRMGHWDLPKGKKDKGETMRETALREVAEEVGLQCQIFAKLPPTRHAYRLKDGRRVLKKTNWYKMKRMSGEVVLQTEESIVDYQWITKQEFLLDSFDSYQSIRDLIHKI